ncbi:hypothetical protein B0H13DRAFT_1850996 [Mycena leptocephala]|nr:hypothetical protein B0H13DRAFT_1850996 [Mycena leptocephala]
MYEEDSWPEHMMQSHRNDLLAEHYGMCFPGLIQYPPEVVSFTSNGFVSMGDEKPLPSYNTYTECTPDSAVFSDDLQGIARVCGVSHNTHQQAHGMTMPVNSPSLEIFVADLENELRRKDIKLLPGVDLGLQAIEDPSTGCRPPVPMRLLVALAILDSVEKRLSLRQIRQAISQRFAGYRSRDIRWKERWAYCPCRWAGGPVGMVGARLQKKLNTWFVAKLLQC